MPIVVGTPVGITANAIDADADDSVTYQLLDDAAGRFDIDEASGLVSLLADDSSLFTIGTVHQIEVQATSSDSSRSVASFTIQVIGSEPSGSQLLVVDSSVQAFRYDNDGAELSTSPLTVNNANPRGTTVSPDGSTYWVIDNNKSVYVYDALSNSLMGEWNSGIRAPEGIATDGTDIWIVSKGTDAVYRFEGGATLLHGTHSPSSSFPLDINNAIPHGIATDGTSIWVVNDSSNLWRVFKYDLLGSVTGSWNLDAANRNPRGIAIDPSDSASLLVVNDGALDQVFRYHNATTHTSGSHSAADTFNLASGNSRPTGFAAIASEVTASSSPMVVLFVEQEAANQRSPGLTPAGVDTDSLPLMVRQRAPKKLPESDLALSEDDLWLDEIAVGSEESPQPSTTVLDEVFEELGTI